MAYNKAMITHIITLLENLVLRFGSLGIFTASFIEEFFAPIPSGIVILSAGYGLMSGLPFTAANLLYLFLVAALPVAIGLTLGSLIWYLFAYAYGEPFIKRFGKYVFVKWADIERARHKYEKRHKSEIGLFILRAVPALPSIIINLTAGLLRVRLVPYVITTFLGTLVRATIISLVGWQVGVVYKEYGHVIDKFEKGILIAVILGLIGYIIYMKRKKSKE
jgi:membrane protein DedA with SNARE-associated domain